MKQVWKSNGKIAGTYIQNGFWGPVTQEKKLYEIIYVS